MNFGVCGAVLSPSFVIDVHRFWFCYPNCSVAFLLLFVCLFWFFFFNGGIQGD